MDAGRAVEIFERQVVDAINRSGLHPVVVRLVLLNLVHVVEDKERQLARAEETRWQAGDHAERQENGGHGNEK